MAEASHLLVHQFSANRSQFLPAGTELMQEAHSAVRQQQLAMAVSVAHQDTPGNFYEANHTKSLTEEEDLQHILDTTKPKHYRRRRSSAFGKQPAKVESQEKPPLEEERELMQDGTTQDQAMCDLQHTQFQQESQHGLKQFQPVEIQQILQADVLDSSPSEYLHGAIVIHKPRPLPLRVRNNTPHPVPACVKLLFDHEYEWLVQWQKKEFQAFTEEVQEALGGTLKKCIMEYNRAFDLFFQPSASGQVINQLSSAATGAAAVSTNSSSNAEDGEESDDHVSLKARQQHLASFNCEKDEKQYVRNSRPRQAGDCSDGGKERQSKHRKLYSESVIDNTRELQKQRMERVLDSFVRARDAVVSIREASHKIQEHKTWISSELNLTRLELLNLKFCRSTKPRSVLREAMELAAIARSFVMELSIALDRDDVGAPWPLPLKADCSDVTPLFLKHLVTTL